MSLEQSQVLSRGRLDYIVLLEGFGGKFSWLQDPRVRLFVLFFHDRIIKYSSHFLLSWSGQYYQVTKVLLLDLNNS